MKKITIGSLTLVVSLTLGLGLAACGDDGDNGTLVVLNVAPECNPLGGEGCSLPWPSSIYEVADSSTATGIRLALPVGALPGNVDGAEVDVTPLNRRSGFSPLTQMLITFPGGVDGSALPGQEELAASLTDGSATVIVDLDTGERVAHFAEIDANIVSGSFDDQALYLRPGKRLQGNHHYAVGITNALRARGGGPLTRPAAFQSILDGTVTDHVAFEATRSRYPAIFAGLAAVGVPQEELVVAWDFTTADDASLIVDQRSARDAALGAVGDNLANVTYTVTLDESPDSRDAGLSRRIHLDVAFPKISDGSAGFYRDANGQVEARGTITDPVIILVPDCATPSNKAGIVVFGHGFFGDLSESEGSYMRRFAKETCNVVVGGLWRGMSADEVPQAGLTLNDLNRARPFAEGVWQGIANFMVLTQLAKTRLVTELLVDDPGGKAPQSIVDPERISYYGISQGGILGNTMYPWDPTLTRAALHVGGSNWAMMFERSSNWVVYGVPLKGAYGGELPSVIMQQVLTMAFEIIDGATIAPMLLDGSLDSALPAKQYLQHISVGDAQVPNVSSLYWSRSAGMPTLAIGSVGSPYGLTTVADGAANALVIMDEDPEPKPPTSNLLSGADNVAHENIRRRPATVSQIADFFVSGEIHNYCVDGAAAAAVCDCAAGNCGEIP